MYTKRIEILHKSGKNVFTLDDVAILWRVEDRRKLIESVKSYVRRKRIFSPHRGIYILDKAYNPFELAQKVISPSYISLYTALALHGVIFQHYSEIHCFAPYSKIIEIGGQKYVYHKMNLQILLNPEGIIQKNNYWIASPERAVCDSLYLNKSFAFDNILNLKVRKLVKISKIYRNQRLVRNIQSLIKEIKIYNVRSSKA